MNTPRNPNAGKFILPDGYRDIGWQVLSDNPDKKKCHDLGHKIASFKSPGTIEQFDNSLFQNRGTDIIRICHTCKMVDHTDMSD